MFLFLIVMFPIRKDHDGEDVSSQEGSVTRILHVPGAALCIFLVLLLPVALHAQ
jgi:hypothetical protein